MVMDAIKAFDAFWAVPMHVVVLQTVVLTSAFAMVLFCVFRMVGIIGTRCVRQQMYLLHDSHLEELNRVEEVLEGLAGGPQLSAEGYEVLSRSLRRARRCMRVPE